MIKVYIGKVLPGVSIVPLLYPNFEIKTKDDWFFAKETFQFFTKPVVCVTADPGFADFLLIPHNHSLIKGNLDYIRHYSDLADKYKKKILVFAYGDSTKKIDIPHSVIIRTSQYKSQKRANEIIMPGYSADLLFGNPLQLRKKGGIPVVGFCGWADFPSLKSKLKFFVKMLIFDVKKIFSHDPLYGARKQGLWFRRKALSLLKKSPHVDINFLIRRSYSGHKKTIIGDHEEVRNEYIDNIVNSDFTLAVRGDGNFSYRFYETLSLGRIPLFIDTDCSLPFEDVIKYDDFVLFVDYRDLKSIDEKIANFYTNMDGDEYVQKQKMAREVFEKYLRIDSFFYFLFGQEKIYNYINDND